MRTQTHYRSGQLGPCKSFTRKKETKHRAPILLFKAHIIRSKFCRGRARKQAWDPARAEHRCRAKALVRTKAATLGIPLGPNPCQGKDQHRHAREFNATRRRLQGSKRPGSLARSGSRSGLAKASEATLGIPLGIPLGANADATQRRHSCGSHTVSTRQTLLHLVRPCQPGLFALCLPTRFS